MTTTASTRTRKSVNAAKSQGIPPVDARSVATPIGLSERRREIGLTISEAMKKLPEIDWKRETPAIEEAFEAMQESMAMYSEGKASKAEVKLSYQAWVKAHKGGLF